MNFVKKQDLEDVKEYQTMSLARPEQSILARKSDGGPEVKIPDPIQAPHIEEAKEGDTAIKKNKPPIPKKRDRYPHPDFPYL